MNLKDLTLREKVFQCFIMKPMLMQGANSLKEYFEKYPIGGLYFSKGPTTDLVELNEGESKTSSQWISECRKLSKYPLLVCADGANIDDDGIPAVPSSVIGSAHNNALAFDFGKAIGMQMNYNDVDWILYPTIDLTLNRMQNTFSPAMSSDPEYTGKVFTQIIQGIKSQNVATTAKHFPGIGTHHVNMHAAPGHNILPFDEWMATYGYTYKKAFEAGVDCVMTSHITLKSYSDKIEFGNEPIATYSRDLTLGLLKGELGFDGVVVTDALTMGGCGVADLVGTAVKAFACGADLLLWPPEEAGDAIVAEIESGNIPMSRLDDAIDRIQRFREKIGIDKGKRAFPKPNKEFVDKTFISAMEQGFVLVRNKYNNIPLDSRKPKARVILHPGCNEAQRRSADIFTQTLNEGGFDAVLSDQLAYDQRHADRLNREYDYLISLFTTAYPGDAGGLCWNMNLMPMQKKVLVNFSSAYFIDEQFKHEDTILQTNCPLTDHTAKIAAKAVLGAFPLTGKLAVNVNI